MSFWIYREGRGGRRSLYLVTTYIQILLVIWLYQAVRKVDRAIILIGIIIALVVLLLLRVAVLN